MASALAGGEFGERTIPLDKAAAQKVVQLKKRIKELRGELNTIEQRAREAIAKTHNKDLNLQPGPQPFAAWNFQADADDQVGTMDVSLVGGAKLEAEGLVLDGKDAFARTKRFSKPFSEKTLEVWVRVKNLNQRGGGVIALQTADGLFFDAIVFAEREAKRWMAGSDGFSRYESFQANEEADTENLIHVTITYGADGTITGYRNGIPYGRAYKKPLKTFPAETSQVVFGLRHGVEAGGNRMFQGTIAQARLYDRALSAEEISVSARSSGIRIVTEADLLRLAPHSRPLSVAEYMDSRDCR